MNDETIADRLRSTLNMSEPQESSVVQRICDALGLDPDGLAPVLPERREP